ncbi:hypothetical protein [Candidatus Lokiarchaeum ossiferum]|uniref:hypothetical protein n=1 Tax=Candidatus Lokiarchaeum ossiferum TaxID=2951803 RepID=UPI00352C87E3
MIPFLTLNLKPNPKENSQTIIMSIKSKYNLTQALKNYKRSILLIIGLSLIISMISVMNIYVYNVKLYKINNLQVNSFDLGIYNSTDSSSVLQVNQEIFCNIEEIDNNFKANFPIESSHPFFFMSNDLVCISSEIEQLQRSQHLNILFSDPNFYYTPQFDRDFEMFVGKKPQNSSEYMIDIVTATKIGYFLNDTRDLHFNILDKQNTSNVVKEFNFNQQNGKLVGIFIPKHSFIPFFRSNLYFNYEYSSVNSIDKAFPINWVHAAILGVIDQSDIYGSPYIDLINTTYSSMSINSTGPWDQCNGIGFHYDRNAINLNKIGIERKDFQKTWSQFYYLYRADSIRLISYMDEIFSFAIEGSNELFSYQILNVPLLICAILVGNLLVKTSFSSRLPSYHQALIKGYPRKMINIQFLWEILFMGISVGLLSIVFSSLFFKPIQLGLNHMLSWNMFTGNTSGSYFYTIILPPESFLAFKVNFGLIMGSIGIAILVCGLIYVKMIVQFQRIKIYEIAESVKPLGLNAELNENLLLSSHKKSGETKTKNKTKIDPSKLENSESTNHDLECDESSLKSNELPETRSSVLDDKQDKYKPIDYKYTKDIKKFGLPLVFGGIIPVILIFAIQWGYSSKYDNIAFLAQELLRFNRVLVVLAFFSPFLLIYGLMRWLIFEKPFIYANICEKFTKIFLGEKGILNALETLRYHNLKVISIILAIISGSLIFSNISLNSSSIRESTIENIVIGGDFNVHGENSWDFMEKGNQTISYENLMIIENMLSNKTRYDNNITDVIATSILSLSDITRRNYNFDTLILSNLSKYEKITHFPQLESGMPQLSSKIQKLMHYNSERTDEIGVLVSDTYLDYYQYEIGDTFSIDPQLFPFTESFASQESFSVTIVDSISFVPGIIADYAMNLQIFADMADFINPEENISHDTLNFIGLIESNQSSSMEVLNQNYNEILEDLSMYYPFSLDLDIATDIDNGTTRIFSPQGNPSELYPLYIEFTILAIFLVISIVMLILIYRKANSNYHGLLLIQGFGKKNISILIITQLIFVVFSSYIIGSIIGFCTGYAWTLSYLKITSFYLRVDISRLNLPIIFNVKEFLLVLGILLAGTFLMLGFLLIGDRKKDYSSYLSRNE